MKTRFLALLAVAAALLTAPGCYTSLDGHVKPGVPMAKDRIENRYERPAEQVYAAARDVLSRNGTLTSDNVVTRTLEAKVDRNTVWVKVDSVEPKVTRVVVQSRKRGGLSNVDLSSEIATQIALGLASR